MNERLMSSEEEQLKAMQSLVLARVELKDGEGDLLCQLSSAFFPAWR